MMTFRADDASVAQGKGQRKAPLLSWKHGIDPHAHTSHALYLAGMTTPKGKRPLLPLGQPWP